MNWITFPLKVQYVQFGLTDDLFICKNNLNTVHREVEEKEKKNGKRKKEKKKKRKKRKRKKKKTSIYLTVWKFA